MIAEIFCCLYACKKTGTNTYTPSASINVTNAVIGGKTLIYNGTLQSVSVNSNNLLPVLAGQQQIDLYTPAVAATTTSPAIPSVYYYNQPLNVTDKSNYSLFLTGASPSAVDAVLITETYKDYTDSVSGVRFINLSPGSGSISVDIQGNPNGSENTGLEYKTYSGFKQYPATVTAQNAGFTFEFRDSASGNLLATYSYTPVTFHNVTLAVTGMESSANILQVNDLSNY